jgi:hypothetical protein
VWDAELRGLPRVVNSGSSSTLECLALPAGSFFAAGLFAGRRSVDSRFPRRGMSSGPIGRLAVFRVAGLDCAWCLSVLSCRGRLHQTLRCESRLAGGGRHRAGRPRVAGTEIGCAATSLIVCLVGYLQSRVRDRCLSRMGRLQSVCVTRKRSPAGSRWCSPRYATGDAMRSDARTAPHRTRVARRTWGVCTSYQGQTGSAWSQQIKRGLSCRLLVCACSEWVVSELAANLVSAWVLGSAMHGKTGMQEAAGHARGVVAVDGRREGRVERECARARCGS